MTELDRYAWLEPGAHAVAAGVYRVPCPLTGDGLRAINAYLIDDGQGLTVIDTGSGRADSAAALEQGVAALGAQLADITRVICTHSHYDHYGLAVQLRRASGAEVLLGRDDLASLDVGADRERYEQWATARSRMLVRFGAADLAATIDAVRGEEFDSIRAHGVNGQPDTLLDDGELISLPGGRTLRAILTPGHTRGHLVYFDEANRLLFAGDHVLPHITPSLGFEPLADGHALERFLPALRAIRELPADTVLPGHGPVFPDLAGRVDELLEHHRLRLEHCVDAVRREGPSTAHAVAAQLRWTRRETPFDQLSTFNRMLAVTETATHLTYLVETGALACDESETVVRWSLP